MIVNEIFSSIDGEAKRAGELATFIRSSGCNLRCSYCDSKYSWGNDPCDRCMTVDDIVAKCKELGNHNITFTGGEPLIQKDADELIIKLAAEGFDVSIETDGAVDFTSRIWMKPSDSYSIWVCADYKCPSSGMNDRMISLDKFALLRSCDVIKFVVGSTEDLLKAKEVIDYVRNKGCDCWIYLSPVFGKIEPKEIVEFMQKNNMQRRIKFQLQLHKFIWPVDARGV